MTALTSAAARAAHLTVDNEPLIYRDTLARAFPGERAGGLIGFYRAHGAHVAQAAARGGPWLSRFRPGRTSGRKTA